MNLMTRIYTSDDLFKHLEAHGWGFAIIRSATTSKDAPSPALIANGEDGELYACGWDESGSIECHIDDLSYPLAMIWHDALRPAEVGSMPRVQDIERILGAAWDEGNATGLDGWVGPGRGAGEIDPEAVQARTRTVNKLLAEYYPEEVTG